MTGRRSTKLAGEVELKRWGPCYIRNKLVFNPRSSSAAWHYALTEVLTSQRKQEDAAPSAQPLRPRNTAAFHLLGIEPGIMWDSQAAAEAPRKKNRGQTMLKIKDFVASNRMSRNLSPAAKSSAGRAEALPLFDSAWWHFQMSGPVCVLLRLVSFFNFKRIYVEGDPTELVISWAMLFA